MFCKPVLVGTFDAGMNGDLVTLRRSMRTHNEF